MAGRRWSAAVVAGPALWPWPAPVARHLGARGGGAGRPVAGRRLFPRRRLGKRRPDELWLCGAGAGARGVGGGGPRLSGGATGPVARFPAGWGPPLAGAESAREQRLRTGRVGGAAGHQTKNTKK